MKTAASAAGRRKGRGTAGRSLIEHIRLLPVLMTCAVLLCGIKSAQVWHGFENLIAARAAPAAAQEGAPAAAQEEMSPTAAAPAETAPADQPAVEAETGEFGESEIALLQRLAARRETLAERARELDLREALLKAAEQRVDEKIARLSELETQIEALLRRHDAQEEQQIASLVKVYEAMKPRDAARIFDQLDLEILLAVAERMRAAKMAAVMAEMDAARAKTLTVELATRRRLPEEAG